MPRPKLKTKTTLRSIIFGHGDVTTVTYDPEGAIQVAGSALLKPALSVARRIAVPMVRRAIRGAFKRFQTARPGVGSKVTKGPLKLGKQVVYGSPKKIGGAVKAAVGVGAAGTIGLVSSHRAMRASSTRQAPAPATAPRPAPSSGSGGSTEKGRKCCPLGTKRMVCFKRGRVKPRKKAAPKKAKPKKKGRKRAVHRKANRSRRKQHRKRARG